MEMREAAVKKFTQLLEEAGNKGHLRFLMAQGCCGPELALDIVPAAPEGDETGGTPDFEYYLEKNAAEFLKNAVMDCDKEGNILITGIPEPHGHHHGEDCCGGHGHDGEDGCCGGKEPR